MESFIDFTLSNISINNPIHYKKANKNVKELMKDDFFERATDFLDRYDVLLNDLGKSREYAVDCYLKMLADVTHESLVFRETGKYTSTSFAEVNERVYNNPNIMEYYMHGLLVSQFLWKHHFAILKFYIENLPAYKNTTKKYLEIGGGHGLYVNEAIRAFKDTADYEVVDISESSIKMAKHFVNAPDVNFIHLDVFKHNPGFSYDFITMGEVLEHVEDPVQLLKKVYDLLAPGGTAFITTPTNAPAIDHLYLFKDREDIVEVINKAGFVIEKELEIYSENVSAEVAKELKIAMMYGAFLKKSL